MKKLLFAACVAIASIAVSAAPVLLVGSLQAVNNTTFTSNTNILSQNFPTPQQLSVTHGALASTNDVVIRQQVSVDNTNWITFATLTMPSTNSTTEVIQGYTYPLTNYYRVQIVTTNSQNVGVSYGN
jgi:hypothetical protein